jgi:hypothetical protein
MSSIPVHLETLKFLGYTPQEAHFLYLVATHSGYFRARQFLGFTRAHWGKRTTQFWTKLQARKTRADGMLSHLWTGLSRLRAKALSASRTRKPPQPQGA